MTVANRKPIYARRAVLNLVRKLPMQTENGSVAVMDCICMAINGIRKG